MSLDPDRARWLLQHPLTDLTGADPVATMAPYKRVVAQPHDGALLTEVLAVDR